MSATLPDLALSVRQPWAWAIIYAGKDVENRDWRAVAKGGMRPLRICIHAAKGMTRDEYEDANQFMASVGVVCPSAVDLYRGGIIGAITVVDIVKSHSSPWFFGPRGLVLHDPCPHAFIPAMGALGFFRWTPGDPTAVPRPAQWMLPAVQQELF